MHAIVQFASAATFWIFSTYRKSSKSIHYPANGQQPIIVPQVFNITAHEYTLLIQKKLPNKKGIMLPTRTRGPQDFSIKLRIMPEQDYAYRYAHGCRAI